MKTNRYLDCNLRHITEADYNALFEDVPFPVIRKDDGVIVLITNLEEDEDPALYSFSSGFCELYARCLKENIDLILFDIDGTVHSELDEFYW